ncbi:toll/interleukin-1 receptor domain-containing protein [Frankia tisae]|uniref:toll/interleukin-1 receptor domain-containing protein n=1 Tax=Frankia tisae TaxID=2950104 RepID=UPI0021BEDC7D|nr:toll/interleukin-1 receptor domain-containing protein [Frankia tisae]
MVVGVAGPLAGAARALTGAGIHRQDFDESGVVISISYTSADLEWALWIGGFLSEEGFTVRTQAWDSAPGQNFIQWISEMLLEADYEIPNALIDTPDALAMEPEVVRSLRRLREQRRRARAA